MEQAVFTADFTDTKNYGAQIGQNNGAITNNINLGGIGKRLSYSKLTLYLINIIA